MATGGIKSIGIWLGWAWLCVEGWLIFFSSAHSPIGSFSPGVKAVVVTGGPVMLLVCLVLALQKEKAAGGLLWLGSAAAALAFACGSGADLGRYFTGFLMVVAPQAIVGTLFIRAGVQRERRESAAQRRLMR